MIETETSIRDELLPLDRLLPDARNPKRHDPESIKTLASQIQAVGFTNPCLVDEKTRILCAGHRRRLALHWLRENNFSEPAGVNPGWLVPCRVGTWSDLQALQVLVGDNEDPARIHFDQTALTALISDLAAIGPEAVIGAGYDEARLQELIDGLGEGVGTPSYGTGAGVDPQAEWEGMPEFVQEDKTAFRTLYVHFGDQEAVEEFMDLIGQSFSPDAKYIWHPKQEREDFMAFRYAGAGSES